jgi:outer membrane receptor protein involved in Fe transport
MAKKFGCVLMVILFFITLTITIDNPLQAAGQDKEKTKKEKKKQSEEEQFEYLRSLTLEELLKVEITTASRQKEKINDIPASVVVLTRADIETYGYQSLAEILRNIPGLYFTNDYATENFGVRGFWTIDPQRNIIILVNDVPQVNHFINANVLEMINIPVEAIDRIEVIRGPMSVMYGTGAFFGAINIKTNIVNELIPISIISGSAGSEKTYKVVARASGRYEDFQYSFNGSFFDTYGIDEPYSKMIDDPAKLPGMGVPEDHTTSGQLENREKYFNISGSYNGVSFDAQYSESHKEVAFISPSITDGSLVLYRSLRLNFGYAKKFSDKIRSEAKFGYFLDKWSFDNDYYFEGIYSNQTNAASGYKADLILFVDPTPKLNIAMGISYINVLEDSVTADIPLFGLPNYHMTLADGESLVTQSIYTQLNYDISDKLKLVAGLRLEQVPEYSIEDVQNEGLDGWLPPGSTTPLTEIKNQATYSYTKVELIPRLALIYGLDERNYFKFLYGKAINRPSFFQSRDLLYYPGDPLEPETIQTFELNWLGTLSNTYYVNLSLFHNILDKLIFRTNFFEQGEYTTRQANVGKMVTNGIEFKLSVIPSRKVNMEFGGIYQQTKDNRSGFENIEPGYSPRFLGYIKAYCFFTPEVSLAITGNYVGEMESYYDHTLENPDGSFGRRLGEKVDGYFILGANFRMRDMWGTGFFINIKGSNLLGQEVRYPATSNNSGYAYRGTIGRGFTFLFTMGYYF